MVITYNLIFLLETHKIDDEIWVGKLESYGKELTLMKNLERKPCS